MSKLIKLACLLTLAAAGVAPSAHAHFKLLSPGSWLKEDDVGGPQKGSPCGPGNTGLLGDDVSPVPTSGMVTEVHAGDTVMVKIQETIYHPGYFRIALAEKREDFTIPPVDDPSSCAFDLSKVPTGAHDNVLMDGLFKVETMSGSNRMLMQEVKLPDKPCDKCTLQVVQVMLNHGLNSCYYYHCADLKILPAGASGSAGSNAAAGGGGSAAAGSGGTPSSAGAGAGTAGTQAAGSGGGGSVAPGTAGVPATPTTPIAGRASTTSPTPVAGTAAASAGTSASVPPTATMASPASPPKSSSCALVPARDGSDLDGALWMLASSLLLATRRRR